MRIQNLGVVLVLATLSPAFGQSAAVDITSADVQKILKESGGGVDHTIRVVDMGSYQLSVAVIHRGPSGVGGGGGRAAANVQHCGLPALPPGAVPGPTGMIAHDDTAETYIVIAGGGTLITGGQIVNGVRSAPESDVTKILNGPSCSGAVTGAVVSRSMGVGDISIIPPGVPHGWTNIATGVTYLSIRPDPKKVLEHGYVNPAIK